MVIKKDTTTSIRKYSNELKVHEKTERTPIKQVLVTDLDYAIWGDFENKTNATSHRNIGSLETAFEDKWNKMSEEFILMSCKSFRRRVNTIFLKNGGHIE